jgi:hypothetical protein
MRHYNQWHNHILSLTFLNDIYHITATEAVSHYVTNFENVHILFVNVR